MILDIFSDTDRIHSYDKDLTQAAENIRILLQGTYARFNEATDPLIIEALIYRMKELETQYSFLIKKAKLERLCGEIASCSVNGQPLKPVLDEILAAANDFEYEAAADLAEKFAEKL